MIIKYYKRIIFVLLILICTLSSCINKDNYSIPSLKCVDNFTATNGSLTNLVALGKEKLQESDIIAEDYIFDAYVSSSDENGNIYKAIFIQDNYENPESAAELSIDATNIYADFPVGSKVRINLRGLVVQKSNNAVKIGKYTPPTPSNPSGMSRINSKEIDRYISRMCYPNDQNIIEKIKPIEFNSIGSALKDDANINKLVKINNVQFENNELTKYLFDETTTTITDDRIITDKRGSKIALKNSRYSTFSNTPISPNYSGAGSITMILTKNARSGGQFSEYGYIRNLNDLELSSDPNTRFPVAIAEEPSPSAINLFNGSDFEDWEAFKGSLENTELQYVTQSEGMGRNGGNALYLEGTISDDSNLIIFTVLKNTEIPKNPKKITFYMKGSIIKKSLSVSIYKENGQYRSFNLGKIKKSHTMINPSMRVGYTGAIDTGGEWVLVDLNLEDIDDINFANGKKLFVLRVGKGAICDILIDDIKIE